MVIATSGDTGAAAIDSIKGKSNLNIFVLSNNRISSVQRKIMTTVEEKNVSILQLMETLTIVKIL